MTTPEEQAAIELAKRYITDKLEEGEWTDFGYLKHVDALLLANALLSLNEKLKTAEIQSEAGTWRVGKKIPMNVYEGDRPVCQCHNEMDAARIVTAMNS